MEVEFLAVLGAISIALFSLGEVFYASVIRESDSPVGLARRAANYHLQRAFEPEQVRAT